MIKSNLKTLLDERELSIRKFAKRINYRIESVRMLCNNDLERLPRELLNRCCEELNVDICELLSYEPDTSDDKAD